MPLQSMVQKSSMFSPGGILSRSSLGATMCSARGLLEISHSPERHRIIVGTDDSCQPLQAMRIRDAFHHVEMQLPIVDSGPVLAITGLDGIHDHLVVPECFGEAQGTLLVLTLVENADLMARDCSVTYAGAGSLRDARH